MDRLDDVYSAKSLGRYEIILDANGSHNTVTISVIDEFTEGEAHKQTKTIIDYEDEEEAEEEYRELQWPEDVENVLVAELL